MKTFREFREAIGLTVYQLAKEIDVSPSLLYNFENGQQQAGWNLIKKLKKRFPVLDLSIFLD